MSLNLPLVFAPLLGALLAVQAALWLIAHLLDRPLRWDAVLAGQVLPWLLLAPWIMGSGLLAPSDVLPALIPGSPGLIAPDPHASEQRRAVLETLPLELEVRHALAARRLPLWSDVIEGGRGLWTPSEAAVLSPVAMPVRAVPIQHHLLGTLAIKILIGLEGMWLLARTIAIRRRGALLAGLSFALGGPLMAWSLFADSAAVAFAPWLAAAIVTVCRAPGSRTLVGAASVSAAALLSGPATISGLVAGAALVWGLWLRRPGRLTASLATATLAAVLGLSLAAPVLLPRWAEGQVAAPLSVQARLDADGVPVADIRDLELGRRGGSSRSLPLAFGALNPFAFGQPYPRVPDESTAANLDRAGSWLLLTSPYVGLWAVTGCALLWFSPRRRRALPFVIVAVLALVVASVVVSANELRGAASVSLVGLLAVAALGLCLGGAAGFEALGSGDRAATKVALVGTVSAVAAASLLLGVGAPVPLLWLLLVASIVLSPSRFSPTRLASARTRLAVGLPLLIVCLDLAPRARGLLPNGEPTRFYAPTVVTEALQATVGDQPWRTGADRGVFAPSIGAFFDLAAVELSGAASPQDLDFLNIRALVSRRDDETGGASSAAPFAVLPAAVDIADNPDVLPRWFLPVGLHRALRSPSDEDGGELQVDTAFEFATRPTTPHLRSLAPGSVRLELPPSGVGRTLATSLPATGWRAHASGPGLERVGLAEVPLNGGFFAATVPPGATVVDLSYAPPLLRPATVVLLVAAVVLLIVAVYGLGPVPSRARTELQTWLRQAGKLCTAVRRSLRSGTGLESVSPPLLLALFGVLAWLAVGALLEVRATALHHHWVRLERRTPSDWRFGSPSVTEIERFLDATLALVPASSAIALVTPPNVGDEGAFVWAWFSFLRPELDFSWQRDGLTAGDTQYRLVWEPGAGLPQSRALEANFDHPGQGTAPTTLLRGTNLLLERRPGAAASDSAAGRDEGSAP